MSKGFSLVVGLIVCLTVASIARAEVRVTGVTDYTNTIVEKIGNWDTVAYNGIILVVDGKTQYAAREWSEAGSTKQYVDRQGSAGLSSNTIRMIGESGEQVFDLDSQTIADVNSSVFSMGSIIQFSQNGEPYVNTANLLSNFDSARYTVRVTVSNNGVWGNASEAFVGSDLEGSSLANRVVEMMSNNTNLSASSIGETNGAEWNGASVKIELTTAKEITLDSCDGSCSTTSCWAYTSGNKWVIGSKLPSATPDNDELEFSGWYTKNSGGSKVLFNSEVSSSTTKLYAQYEDSQTKQEELEEDLNSGTVMLIEGVKYKLTYVGYKTGTAKVTGVYSKKIGSVSIPGTFNLDGYKIKVTEIAKGAFKDCTKLKTVKIGSNVRVIRKNAFKGCTRLKKISITSKVLYSIGKKALSGVPLKCVYALPKTKRNLYVSLIRKAR
jgi:hypothetical protein